MLIKRDQPDAGTSPIGPGSAMILLGGMAGGLLGGLGLVFITVPIGEAWGRRRSDYQQAGRRNVDRTATPTSPTVVPTAPAGIGRRAADQKSTARRGSDVTTTNRRENDNATTNRRTSDTPSVVVNNVAATGATPINTVSDVPVSEPMPVM